MKIFIPLLLLAALLPEVARADPPTAYTPFDMSHERPVQKVEQPKKQETVKGNAGKSQQPASETVQQAVAPAQPKHRYLIPFPELRLEGEAASRSWIVYLTPSEARSAKTLSYGYQNAIFVAPETSNLLISLNDTLIEDKPIQSSEGISQRGVTLPLDLLRPGANKLTFRVAQRHRTDCTIQSTYDLWTDIKPDKTYLVLDPKAAPGTPNVDDVKAVGVDEEGRTHFHIVVPKMPDSAQANLLMRVAQGLALMARMPSQSFTIGTALAPTQRPGDLDVVVGPAAAVASLVPALPDAAKSSGFSGFVKGRNPGEAVLVFSGPTWQAVETAIENVVAPLDQSQAAQRRNFFSRTWTGSDTILPLIGTRLTFAQLGVATSDFHGRHFRTGFDIGVPADFYSYAAGQTTIYLDAAYSDEVLPGSSINIYVNGDIASTVPITGTGGDILRHLPVTVTMRHLRPGINRFDVDALLLTKADQACVPGAAEPAEPRFALFNTTELQVPTYARIARLPNIEATAETGFPYGEHTDKIPVYMNRIDSPTLSTAATLLGKLALASGRPLQTALGTSATHLGDDNAILIGAISQIPPVALSRVHIAEESRTSWGNASLVEPSDPDSRSDFDEWGRRVRGVTLIGRLNALGRWLTDTFDMSPDAFKFIPPEDVDMTPADSATFLAAQGMSPDGKGIWTLLSAPDDKKLQDGMQAMSDVENWEQMTGHLVFYKEINREVTSVATTSPHFVETQPFSLNNWRLIAANWLSLNSYTYAAVFAGLAVLLGIATSFLLTRFGRRA